MAEATFIDRCLSGETTADQLDEHVDAWHKGEVGRKLELRESIGMTCYEYADFLKDANAFERIVAARREAAAKQ